MSFSNPLLYYTFDDGTGTVTDHGSGGNNGTAVNSPTWGIGKIGQGITLNGSNQYITTPNVSALQLTGPWSYAIWCKRSRTGTDDPLFSNWLNSSGGRQIYIYFNFLNKVEVDIPWISNVFTSASTITDTLWHHIGVTRSGSNWKIFIDGTLDATATDSTAQEASTATNQEIGRSGPAGTAFSGSLDEARVYNTDISADMAALAAYTGGSSAKPWVYAQAMRRLRGAA